MPGRARLPTSRPERRSASATCHRRATEPPRSQPVHRHTANQGHAAKPAHRNSECGELRPLRWSEPAARGPLASPSPNESGPIRCARGMSAPGSGVCTRRGGGTGRLPGSSAPGSGVCTRSGGSNARIGASQPPPRVQTPIPGAQLPPRRRSQPPSRVQTPESGAPPRHGGPQGAPTPAPKRSSVPAQRRREPRISAERRPPRATARSCTPEIAMSCRALDAGPLLSTRPRRGARLGMSLQVG